MIRFFRQSYIIQYVAIALLCVALWVPSFITGNVDVSWRSPVSPLYNLLADLLDFWPPCMLLFAMLLMAFEVMFFNSILVENQLNTKVSTLGAVVFLLVMNLMPVQTTFYPFLLALVFLLFFINIIFLTYQTAHPELYLLNAGVFLSLATMCYFPTLLLVVWGVISLSILHRGSIRLHVIPILGLLLPYFFYFSFLFLRGDLLTVLQAYGDYFLGFSFSVDGFDRWRLMVLGLLLLVSLIPVFFSQLYSFEKSIAVRTKVRMTIVLLLLGVVMLFIGEDPMQTGVFFVALSVLFSYQLSYLDKLKWSNITFILFMLLVLAFHYVPLFI